MLNLPDDEPIRDPFDPLSLVQARQALKRGVAKNIVDYLRQDNADPRLFMIRDAGWVRTFGNRIQVWQLTDRALTLLKRWAKTMDLDQHETFDLEELSTGQVLAVNAKQLRAGASPEALKAYGTGVGRYRNPATDTKTAAQEWAYALHEFFGNREHDVSNRHVEEIGQFLSEHFPVPESILGSGVFGTAYLMPDNTVLKLTFDLNDLRAATIVLNEPAERLVTVLMTALLPFKFLWSFHPEVEPYEVKLGIVSTAYVPHLFSECHTEFKLPEAESPEIAFAVERIITRDVHEAKNKFKAWPEDLANCKPGSCKNRMQNAQEELINRIADKPQNPFFDDIVRALQELQEREIFTIDVHASNWRCDGEHLVLIDFGAGEGRDEDIPVFHRKGSNPGGTLPPAVFVAERYPIPVLGQ